MKRQAQRGYSPTHAKTWVCDQVPGAGVLKNTRSEAIGWFKKLLGVKRLPEGYNVHELQR